MTPDERRAARARCEATPGGEWIRAEAQDGEALPDGTGYAGDYYETTSVVAVGDGGEPIADCHSGAIADFVKASKRDLLAALNDVDEALATVSKFVSVIERIGWSHGDTCPHRFCNPSEPSVCDGSNECAVEVCACERAQLLSALRPLRSLAHSVAPRVHARELPQTLSLTLGTGKKIQIDYYFDSDGRAFSVGIYGPGTYAANAGLTAEESAEVSVALAQCANEVHVP